MDFLTRAYELQEETIANRRHIHQHAETGLDLPETVAFVKDKLTEYGLAPTDCGHGVTATLGKGSPVLLLRADMDALAGREQSGLDFQSDGLPIREDSGESFSCTTGAMHACGHDFHAAMLLSAARMLKEEEASLAGTVKFMFQPAEETFQGAKDMIENGILQLQDPKYIL
mgnify:CR=1 FL=1